jgi:estrogen-related receptor ERR
MIHRPQNSYAHVSALLLCLPSLRQSDGAIKRFWLAMRRDGKVAMNKLLVEMLEAHFR